MLQSTGFLAVVTVLAVLLLTFPSYAHLFYAQNVPVSVTSPTTATLSKQVAFAVKGMGCAQLRAGSGNGGGKTPRDPRGKSVRCTEEHGGSV